MSDTPRTDAAMLSENWDLNCRFALFARGLERELTKLRAENEALKAQLTEKDAALARFVEVLKPFAHPDLSKLTSNNVQGQNSPVFGRDGAVLYIKDFASAASVLGSLANPTGLVMG